MVITVDDSPTLAEEIFYSATVISAQPDPDPGNNVLTQAIPLWTR